jgi:uncharacterized protein YukE
MLPFLKREKEAGVSGPVETITRKADEGSEEYDSMHAAAEDLIHALETKNVKNVAEALRAAFHIADAEPHIEGEHE